jgi:hypothetical protein
MTLVTAVVATTAGAQQPLDARVLPREVADDVLRLWNATGTLRVSGPYLIEAAREVTGDVGVSGGALTVAGRVTGSIVAVNADVRLERGARVDGEILVVGGRVTGQDSAQVAGQVRVYRARMDVARAGDRMVDPPRDDERGWWRPRERWRDRAWSDLRLVSARTYNRVEGLPLLLGPTFGRDFGTGRVSVEAYGIWRSAQGFKWNSDNVGHSIKAEVQLGDRRGLRLGGRQFDVVAPVESWHLSDTEVGLASVLLHRDFRDYYNRHGGTMYASVFRGSAFDATVSYSDERWGDRRTRDPWTLFRNDEAWRENPILDEGDFHVVNGTLRYDTRTDVGNPWSGWYILADYEYGTGTIARYGLAAPGTRTETVGGATVYDRVFVDVRRYNRIAPGAQLNLRLVAGGWLSGDDLPMQRRFSLGGPGTLGGYDFRRTVGAPDVLQCSTPVLQDAPFPIGTPAQCERFAMAQVEYRGDMQFDLFGVLDEERDRRRAGWGRGTEWVVFADAGRGWLVGAPDGGLSYAKGSIPGLSTFRTDVGIGLVLDNVGVYVAKALSDRGTPLNVFVRLRPRF